MAYLSHLSEMCLRGSKERWGSGVNGRSLAGKVWRCYRSGMNIVVTVAVVLVGAVLLIGLWPVVLVLAGLWFLNELTKG